MLTHNQKIVLLQSVKLCFFGLTVATALEHPHLQPLERDLDAVEIFSQAKAVVNAARDHKLNAEGYDWMDGAPSVLTEPGFWCALKLVLRLKPQVPKPENSQKSGR